MIFFDTALSQFKDKFYYEANRSQARGGGRTEWAKRWSWTLKALIVPHRHDSIPQHGSHTLSWQLVLKPTSTESPRKKLLEDNRCYCQQLKRKEIKKPEIQSSNGRFGFEQKFFLTFNKVDWTCTRFVTCNFHEIQKLMMLRTWKRGTHLC